MSHMHIGFRTLAPFVAWLPKDDYERGNARMFPGGRTVSIDVSRADAIRVGRRKHRSGLLYHEGFHGFIPCMWPHVVSPPASVPVRIAFA